MTLRILVKLAIGQRGALIVQWCRAMRVYIQLTCNCHFHQRPFRMRICQSSICSTASSSSFGFFHQRLVPSKSDIDREEAVHARPTTTTEAQLMVRTQDSIDLIRYSWSSFNFRPLQA